MEKIISNIKYDIITKIRNLSLTYRDLYGNKKQSYNVIFTLDLIGYLINKDIGFLVKNYQYDYKYNEIIRWFGYYGYVVAWETEQGEIIINTDNNITLSDSEISSANFYFDATTNMLQIDNEMYNIKNTFVATDSFYNIQIVDVIIGINAIFNDIINLSHIYTPLLIVKSTSDVDVVDLGPLSAIKTMNQDDVSYVNTNIGQLSIMVDLLNKLINHIENIHYVPQGNISVDTAMITDQVTSSIVKAKYENLMNQFGAKKNIIVPQIKVNDIINLLDSDLIDKQTAINLLKNIGIINKEE